MNYFKIPRCAICGKERSNHEPGFLLVENSWEDKLTILHWNEDAASREGVQVACGIDHVEELAIHWMTTGRLDYPFARTILGAAAWRHISRPGAGIYISGAKRIGELAVHRESMENLLTENPRSLKVILDALLNALRQEIGSEAEMDLIQAQEKEEEETSLCAVSPEPKF